jgi:hypothetical protein
MSAPRTVILTNSIRVETLEGLSAQAQAAR